MTAQDGEFCAFCQVGSRTGVKVAACQKSCANMGSRFRLPVALPCRLSTSCGVPITVPMAVNWSVAQ
eukprot:2255680-Prymnesium_polylepis.1